MSDAAARLAPDALPATVIPAPTETSPLLGHGHLPNGNGDAVDNDGQVEAGDGANGPPQDPPRDGNPAMAKKMHLFLPAVGIGVGTFLFPVRSLRIIALRKSADSSHCHL